MAVPALQPVAAHVYGRTLAPMGRGVDESNGYALAYLTQAQSLDLEPIDLLVRGSVDGPPGYRFVDAVHAPDVVLPWLAQFAGVTAVKGGDPAVLRGDIQARRNYHRGGPQSVIDGARKALVPSVPGQAATVVLLEFYQGDAYQLGVVTLPSETPDVVALRNAISAPDGSGPLPALIKLTLIQASGQVWDAVDVTHTWDAAAVSATWDQTANTNL